MQKSIQFANRRFIWVKEQPGPVLLLVIALTLMLSVHFFAPAENAPTLQDAADETSSAR